MLAFLNCDGPRSCSDSGLVAFGNLLVGQAHDHRIDVGFDVGQREDIQHSLAVAHDIDKLITLAQHHGFAADHDVRGGYVGIDMRTQIVEHLAH